MQTVEGLDCPVLRASSSPILAIRRVVEVGLALLALVILSPFLALVSVLIKLDSPGPVLYEQRRVGLGGRLFKIFKFRTMVDDADQTLVEYLEGDAAHRLSWDQYQKLWHDPRLTRFGRMLRRFSIDEIPQLWNVLKGDMSLVGPRPFFPEQLEAYGEAYAYYIQVRPGLTGLWQVNGRNHTSFAERAWWDAYYVSHWSIKMDLAILLKTVWVVLSGKGAY